MFVLRLHSDLLSVHTLAKDTGRGSEFENKTIIETILAKRIPHLTAKWTKKVVKNSMEGNEALSFDEFLKFLDTEHTIAEMCFKNPTQGQSNKPIGAAKVAATTAATTAAAAPPAAGARSGGQTRPSTPSTSNGGCGRCGGPHRLPACDVFKGLAVADRRKFCMNTRTCYLCLEAGHMARNCRSTTMCSTCNDGHHILLHPAPMAPPPPPAAPPAAGGGAGGNVANGGGRGGGGGEGRST